MTDSPRNSSGGRPPDQPQGNSLKSIRNARNRLLVCFLTFPVYAWAITALLNQGNDITLYMILYMIIYAIFGINASVKRCPACGEQFFVKRYFLNIFTSKCTHCGISYHADSQ